MFRLVRFLLLLALVLVAGLARAEPPAAANGAIDLRQWDFGRDGIVSLDGQWLVQWDEFGDPRRTPNARTVDVPGDWNAVGGTSFGRATYHLTVQCQRGNGLALSLPVQHNAAQWFVNGALVAQQGQPGASARGARPASIQQTVALGSVACPLHIVAHVSNFEMRRGGLMRAVELGEAEQLAQRRELGLMRDLLAIGGLVVLGVLPLLFYLGRRSDRSPLYFGLFCLVFALGMGISGARVLQPVFSTLSWDRHLQLVFLCWYTNNLLFALFVRSMYPEEVSPRAVRLIAGWVALSCATVLFTSSRFFTQSLPLLTLGSALVGSYIAWRLVAARLHGRRTALLLLGGLLVLAATVVHDSVRYAYLTRLTLVPYGIMVFVAAPAYLMARRFARALMVEERVAIEQRERANLLVRSTKAGLLDWDAVKNRTDWSDRLCEMLRVPALQDGPRPDFWSFVHPGDREAVQASFMRQMRDRSVKSGIRTGEAMDYRLCPADGSEPVWIHAEAVSVCDADGRTLRYICSFIDISDRKRHEAEMDNRVKFIQDLFDSVPLGLALRDPEGKHLFVNRAWEQNIGLPRESVLGTSLGNIPIPEAQAAMALDREALERDPHQPATPREADYKGRRFMQTRTPMIDAQGNRIGVLVASLDITEKHAAEQALATERERLRLLVRSTKAGFGDWDAVRDTVTYTDRFKEMLGYPADADTTAWPSIFELMHPDDRERSREQFRAMIRRKANAGEQEPGEPMSYRLQRRDGSYIWIHAEGISQVDEAGRTVRFITSYLDVTRFHEQEDALRAQMALTRTEQRRLDLVVRGARVGIVDWDGRSHETYYSPIFREIRGYAPDADTRDWPDYFRVMIHPDDRARITGRWVEFIKGRGPEGPRGEYYAPEEYRLLRADGSYVWVQVSGMAVRDERDFVIRWIAAIIDITERRAQEQLLQQQNEALKENVRLREEVERIGRHDIKTPLNSIVAVPRLLREERRLGPEADELLGIVERAGYRILSMVNLSLDLYKMEQGSYIFRPDAVDLNDLVDKVLADVRMHAASKGVHFDVALGGAAYAWAEELLCYSLLANLIKNAVEASPEGGVVRIRAEAGEPGTVILHIQNRGEVPEAIRSSFFQKYATLGKASGTGLGTYSARLMARVQDGDIAMRTGAEEGTTLSVTLRAAPEGVTPATVRHVTERARGGRLRIASLPPQRVLLVDDDEYNLLIVRRFLPSPPFTVDTAINGRMALAAAERHWPDVLFMDLDMPVMGGLQAVQELRAMEKQSGAKRCTMIALSSHEDADTQAAALAAGFDHYLTKPVTRDVVHETLLGAMPPSPAPAAAARIDDPVLVDADMEASLPQYIASRRALLATLPATLAAGEREELRRLAHQLAGSLGLYGFRWAADQCRWIERHHADIESLHLAELAHQLQAHLETADIRFITEEIQP